MLHKQHGGFIFQNQFFDLDAGVEVDVIQRLVPDVQVSLLDRLAASSTFFFCTAERSSMFFWNCTAEKPSWCSTV